MYFIQWLVHRKEGDDKDESIFGDGNDFLARELEEMGPPVFAHTAFVLVYLSNLHSLASH